MFLYHYDKCHVYSREISRGQKWSLHCLHGPKAPRTDMVKKLCWHLSKFRYLLTNCQTVFVFSFSYFIPSILFLDIPLIKLISGAALYVGQSLALHCTHTRTSDGDFIWMRNGTVLPNETSHIFFKKHVTTGDEGSYKCGVKLCSRMVNSTNSEKVIIISRLIICTYSSTARC